MPAKFEKFSNNAVTTLNGSINNTITTIVVNDGSVFPNDGNYRVRVGTELLLVTSRSSNVLTVIRGAENTSPLDHSDTNDIVLVLTKASWEKSMSDYMGLWGDSARLGPLNSIEDGVGNTLNASSFGWNNQGTSSITDLSSNGIQWLFQKTTGANVRMSTLNTPSTPYTTTALFYPGTTNDAGSISHTGIVFREASSGKLITFACNGDKTLQILRYTDETTFSADEMAAIGWNISSPFWQQVSDDGTNISWAVSQDGINFVTVATSLRGSFFDTAPDRVGIYGNANSTTQQSACVLVYWRTE